MKAAPAEKISIERQSPGFEEYVKAMLNILDDFTAEKTRLEEMHRAVINILNDFADERNRMEDAQRAVLNILEDSTDEKVRLEEAQKAMLNLLQDFDVERTRTEGVNAELRKALDSVRLAKEAADAANTELQAFSYSVSHDLRAPLRAMDGFSQALIEDYSEVLDDMGRDYLHRIRTASQRMALLIDALLKLSRLTRGELNIAPVNLSTLVRGIAAELQRTNPGRTVKVRIAGNVTARGDLNLLKVVLENLLANAWKFTSKKSDAVIEFGETRLEGVQVYYVKDNGAGFDMKYVDKLFGTFQRLHAETDYPGTGIGLSIISRIITRHGGSVCARGALGKGATFYFSINSIVLKNRCMEVQPAA